MCEVYDQQFLIAVLFVQRMLAGENKKSIDAPDQKDPPVTIVNSSFPDILCEERINSWKNDFDTPVFGKWFVVTVIFTSRQTTVCLFDVFLNDKISDVRKVCIF